MRIQIFFGPYLHPKANLDHIGKLDEARLWILQKFNSEVVRSLSIGVSVYIPISFFLRDYFHFLQEQRPNIDGTSPFPFLNLHLHPIQQSNFLASFTSISYFVFYTNILSHLHPNSSHKSQHSTSCQPHFSLSLSVKTKEHTHTQPTSSQPTHYTHSFPLKPQTNTHTPPQEILDQEVINILYTPTISKEIS